MSAKKKHKHPAAKTVYEPTPQERSAFERFRAHGVANPAPRMKVSKTGDRTSVAPDHPEEAVGLLLLMEAIGSLDAEFFDGIVNQLYNAASQGREIDERGVNFMLSVIKGINPKDQVEAMLAAQMAAVHMATMRTARVLAHVENIPQQDSAERAFNKLARTFASQMEALKRYRTGGEQKVTVQHVSVNEGGQAIVGNVTHPPREAARERTAPSVPALADAKATPMPLIKDSKESVTSPARRRSRK